MGLSFQLCIFPIYAIMVRCFTIMEGDAIVTTWKDSIQYSDLHYIVNAAFGEFQSIEYRIGSHQRYVDPEMFIVYDWTGSSLEYDYEFWDGRFCSTIPMKLAFNH
eukprot:GHVO01022527.1.p1 GENE.GHVO01022527.1~~GHVO01022527.1.p1  ORF type:complete len:105 (+),score=0.03 GHVO01022527.1:294-608(+)